MSRSLHDKWTRAQSEVVGVALLVGVFALLALLVGTVVIGNVTNQASDEPLAEINTSATAENLTLTHGGGDGFEETAITVILRQNGDETRYGLDSFTENRGSDTARFSAGERWVRSHTLTTGLARVLVVHEPSNAVVHDEQIVVPAAPNREPVAAFEYSPEAPGTNESITFDASDSYDSDGSISSYEWDFGDEATTTGRVVNHSYTSPGEYDVILAVTDDEGARNTSLRTVVANDPPDAALAVDCPGRECTFDASNSTDDGTIENHTWNFDDGNTTTTTGSAVDYTYDSDGIYNVTVTVTDTLGGTDTVARTVTVDTTEPSVTNATLADDDGDGFVTSGDNITISANVLDPIAGAENVTANASAFDAGTVTLRKNVSGIYTGTATVGTNATEGNRSVMITATDTAGNTAAATTGTLTVDTTPPTIETFDVIDDGSIELLFGFIPVWVEQYQITWAVDDPNLANTTVTVRNSAIVSVYPGEAGTETYEQLGFENTQYVITIESRDAAGNTVCQNVTDGSDGIDPTDSQYDSC